MTTSTPMPEHHAQTIWKAMHGNVSELVVDVLAAHPEIAAAPPMMLATMATMAIVVEHGVEEQVLLVLARAQHLALEFGRPWVTVVSTMLGSTYLLGRAFAASVMEALGHEALVGECLTRVHDPGVQRLLCVVLGPSGATALEVDEPPAGTPDRSLN